MLNRVMTLGKFDNPRDVAVDKDLGMYMLQILKTIVSKNLI